MESEKSCIEYEFGKSRANVSEASPYLADEQTG
jgi:hypothetical protein